MSFKTFVDVGALSLAMDGKKEISYYNDVPLFLEKTYNSIKEYLKLENVIPEINIKIGGRTENIFFKKEDNLVGRIIVNIGPDDNFRLSKALGKTGRMFDELSISQMCGQHVGTNYNDHDILLMGNPKREITIYEKKFNGRGKPYMASRNIFKIRALNHQSIVMVINLRADKKDAEAEQEEGPRRIVQEEVAEDAVDSVVGRI